MKSYVPSLGIEQEFQLVDPRTGNLCSRSRRILARGKGIFGERLKEESKQCCIELVSNVCPTIADARTEIQRLTSLLKSLVAEENVSLIGAGTHPYARWQEQEVTPREHYLQLEDELQDLERELVIYGLHVHVGIPMKSMALPLIQQLSHWLPHLLALSTNSPFWEGQPTGYKSYRANLWRTVPRTGIPPVLTANAFHEYTDELIAMQCIENGKGIFWDIRPHPSFPTVEFRVFDMPSTIQDVIALAALCQALVTKLYQLQSRPEPNLDLSRSYLEENYWQAMRYGLDAQVINFERRQRLPMRAVIHQLLDFVADAAVDLGSEAEIAYLRRLLESPEGTGADRQLALYRKTGDIQQVAYALMDQTMAKSVSEPVGALTLKS
ncbi:putative glutamate--cysteine ligase 2 [Ktedonobacter sp. SOSP1-52]|uniref:carboxylate-amine ligase n=1 Tax=Ktedonobacter sp. SOSP1-52 TaxID=2778366 RepID=UPI00191643D6|nr:carboxylate-amine ligase [Ktedonobacter sp. SOSP1-52]GHO70848.1 putative glutamate--cysteine ligase 2 [Ktedonobacter sp. SOSP1-52]